MNQLIANNRTTAALQNAIQAVETTQYITAQHRTAHNHACTAVEHAITAAHKSVILAARGVERYNDNMADQTYNEALNTYRKACQLAKQL